MCGSLVSSTCSGDVEQSLMNEHHILSTYQNVSYPFIISLEWEREGNSYTTHANPDGRTKENHTSILNSLSPIIIKKLLHEVLIYMIYLVLKTDFIIINPIFVVFFSLLLFSSQLSKKERKSILVKASRRGT